MTHEQLIERARALVPILRERLPATTEARRVLPETIKDFHEAGFFKMLMPERWGGFESDPSTFFEVQYTLAEGCPSSAWVFGVVAVHSWQLALFPDQAQQDVWEPDREAIISSSYAPTGKIEVVEGGFRVNGRWSFSSGCDNCQWIFLGGLAPEMYTFLLPRSDYTIEDNWDVGGLVGTGSKDIVVDNAFVPAHRTHKLIDGFKTNSPGNELNTAPLFRVPFGQIFVRSVSTTAIGIAQATLDQFLEVARNRVSASTSGKVSLDPTVQMACARAASLIDGVKLTLHRNIDELMDFASRSERPSIERRVQFRFESALAVERCVEAVDMLFATAGGRAIFNSNPMLAHFLNAHAAQAHFANKTDKPARNFGTVLLGQKTEDYFV